MLTSPLALLERLTAYRVFEVIMVLISVGYLGWMTTELDLRGWRAAVGAGTLLLSSRMLGVLALGQLHPLVVLGLVAAWVAGRRGRSSLYGCALGLVVAIKPLVISVLLLPLVRRQWRTLGIAIVSGLAVTIVGVLVAGPTSMLDWLGVLNAKRLNGFWDNASIHGAVARLFTENEYVEPISELPGVEVVAYVSGVVILILTALRARRDPEMGLWALVAAALLASPIGWWTYFVLFGPGILLLLARGQTPLALLLLSLQFIPPEWSTPWRYGDTVAAPLALTLNLCVLIVYWLAFFLSTHKQASSEEGNRPAVIALDNDVEPTYRGGDGI